MMQVGEKAGFNKLFGLFITFFKIGLFTIGGGLAMIPVIRKEFVEKQGWVSDEKIVDIFAVAQSLPGAIAINSSMYLGYEMAGLGGLIASALGVILPSFIIMLIITLFLSSIGDNIYISRFLLGIKSSVVPLILLAGLKLGKSAVRDKFGVVLVVLGAVSALFFDIDVIYIVVTGGLAGYIFYTYRGRVNKR